MKSLSLDGKYSLKWFSQGEGEKIGVWKPTYEEKDWLDAQVPGEVHLDLIRAGIIKEPLYDRNVEKCQWVEEKEWWYRKEFLVSKKPEDKRAELLFEGLDTTADIYLNGSKIGEHDNCFIPYRIDVSKKIREGKNVLAVKLDAGKWKVRNKPIKKYVPEKSGPFERIFIRKPQFTFKWDWAPRLLNCGIWRGVNLVFYEEVAIRNVCLSSALKRSSAEISMNAELENFSHKRQVVNLRISLKNTVKHSKEVRLAFKPGLNKIKSKIKIKNPLLWWSKPYGKPNLYDFSLKVTKKSRVLDEYACRYGIREIKLLQEPLGKGEKSFTFSINGKKIFSKGANWVPADFIPARISREKYEKLVSLAEEANFNMFRIWGGGIYEDPCFYEFCDEKGIMVWQDFMFACAPYPDDDPKFCKEVKHEAELAVKQLHNHPCLVMLCGNNECQMMHEYGHFYGGKIYLKILPDVCRRFAPDIPYWPGSPYGGDYPNSRKEGDVHSWNVSLSANFGGVNRVDYKNYRKEDGKFISEFGYLGPLGMESIKRYLPKEKRFVDSPSWSFHSNEYVKRYGRNTISMIISMFYGEPWKLSLDEYIKAGQIIQGEAYKFALEYFRSRKYNCSGSLFWMYSDAWPEVGWTIVDYYLNKKASYYYVKRAYQPVLVTIKQEDDYCFSIWVVNDTLKKLQGELEYGLKFPGGKEKEKTKKVHIKLPANSSRCVKVVIKTKLWNDNFLYAKLRVKGKVLSENRYFPVPLGDLDFPKTTLNYSLRKIKDELCELTVSSASYAIAVHMDLPAGACSSDNYFDIFPGDKKKILIKGNYTSLKKMRISAINSE